MQKPTKVQRVEEVIAQAANVRLEDINGKARDHEIVAARHAVWMIAHDHLKYSYSLIGKFYDRDHTTIMNGVKRFRKGKVSQKIIDGIKNVAPEIFDGKPEPGVPRAVDAWKFGDK